MYDWSIQVEEFLLQEVKINNENKAVIDNSILSITAFFGIIEKVKVILYRLSLFFLYIDILLKNIRFTIYFVKNRIDKYINQMYNYV